MTLCASEEEVYERLGYAYIEPELREARGELAAAREGSLPELVEIGDIRGELHCHTTLSDGRNTLEEMAEAGRARGYAYMAITDHSASHGFGDHVTEERLWERIGGGPRVEQGQARLPAAGRIGGQHRHRRLARLPRRAARRARLGDRQRPHRVQRRRGGDDRARLLAAIENPLVDCIGHLTGRLLLRRPPYPVDIEAVADAAARTGTMLEINGNPNRRDLSEQHARLAAEAGAMIVLNTDAHGVDTLENIRLRGGDRPPRLARRRADRQHPRLARVQGDAQARGDGVGGAARGLG